MKKLTVFAQDLGAKSMSKVVGPNGAFISMVMPNGTKKTIPVGKKSQKGKLADYNVLVTNDGQAIATVNNYKVAEEIAL